jgi:sucrose phosphorylase
MPIPNKIQLMTYPDSLGGNLKNLKIVLDKYLKNTVSFVHILPPYPSSADRGFSPLTHLEIEPKFGNWGDLQTISKDYGLMLDLIAGHVSVKSIYFEDYLKNGENSAYYDMFMRVEKTFEDGNIKISELEKFAYLTPVPPLILFKLENGNCKLHFKTFMAEQADLDINSSVAREILTKFVENHAKMGIKMIRLDAVETICKNRDLGYHMVPEVFEVIQWLIDLINSNGMEVLCEMFAKKEIKERIIKMGAWVYDFNLPDLILHSIYTKKTEHLKTWFKEPKEKYITVLTNHDGFMTGRILETLSKEDAELTRQIMLQKSGESTQKASGFVANNIASDGINATLMEAVFRDQNEWLTAHILHLFAPGIPQMYYNDILGQRNDEDLYKETGEGRSLIRHNHLMETLDHKFKQPFVQKLLKIMELRNSHKAFEGKIDVLDCKKSEFKVEWIFELNKVSLNLNLKNYTFEIKYTNQDNILQNLDLTV